MNVNVPSPETIYQGGIPSLPDEIDLQALPILSAPVISSLTNKNKHPLNTTHVTQQQMEARERRKKLISRSTPPYLDVFICKSSNLTGDAYLSRTTESDTVMIPDLSHINGCRTRLLDADFIGKNLKAAVSNHYPSSEQHAIRTVERFVEEKSATRANMIAKKKEWARIDNAKVQNRVGNRVNDLVYSSRLKNTQAVENERATKEVLLKIKLDKTYFHERIPQRMDTTGSDARSPTNRADRKSLQTWASSPSPTKTKQKSHISSGSKSSHLLTSSSSSSLHGKGRKTVNPGLSTTAGGSGVRDDFDDDSFNDREPLIN